MIRRTRSHNRCVFGRPSRGITLIELLLVLAIISFLLLLAIPALQAARESARRSRCTHNLQQFGIALTNFEARNKAFPSSITLRVEGTLNDDFKIEMHNCIVDLLPFLDSTTLYAQYHRHAMFCAPENADAIAAPLRFAVCPSAPSRQTTPANTFVPSLRFAQSDREHPLFGAILKRADNKYSTTFEGAVSDYAVPLQVEDGLARALGYKVPEGSQPGLRSMFPSPLEEGTAALGPKFKALADGGRVELSIHIRARDVKDGLSHTMTFAEVGGRPQHWSMGKRNSKFEPLVSAWADPWISFRVKGFFTPDQERCVLDCDNDGEIYSFHPGGVNLLFADGHVDFLSADTDSLLILAFVTPDQDDNKSR